LIRKIRGRYVLPVTFFDIIKIFEHKSFFISFFLCTFASASAHSGRDAHKKEFNGKRYIKI